MDIKKKKMIKKSIYITTLLLLIVFISSIGFEIYKIYDDNKITISDCIKAGNKKFDSIDVNTFNSKHPTVVLDKDGNVIKEFKTIEYKYETYENIDERVFKAFVAIEDERYYEHKGIDYKGLLRAFYIMATGGDIQGGSTITQQLTKNIFLTMDVSIWRKLEEMVIAQKLEQKYSKEEILEFYVNNINYGNGCYSIESAADYYFQKTSKDLTMNEIATLVAIPNNPTLFDPITNYENNKNRRIEILNCMVKCGYLTEEEYRKIKNEDIALNVKNISFDNTLTDYAISYAVEKATEELMRYKGFQFKYEFSTNEERVAYYDIYNKEYNIAYEQLISGGYVIETSIDRVYQDKLQEVVDSKMSGYTYINPENGLYMKQASATVIDNATGEVIAIVGGRSQEGNTYNRASLGARQPGSTIKPVISYLPAYERGYYPDMKYEDKEIKDGPKNWYLSYYGQVTLRYATEISINTIPYRLTSQIGVDNALQYLRNMKFEYLTETDIYPIIAVGGFTLGTTTEEMAGAYATIARNGEFIEPTNLRKVSTVGTNEVIYENSHIKKRIYDAGASYLMTDTLRGVNMQPHGTGYRARLTNYKYQAGKSGTTDDNVDGWYCGYTPYYTMSVWVGDDTPTPQNLADTVMPHYIWNGFMEWIHEGKEVIDFEIPSTVYKENGVLKAKISEENQIKADRIKKEELRKSTELQVQYDRLAEEEYRIIYGLTEEEELQRESKASSMLNKLEGYKFEKLEQQEELSKLLSDTKLSIYDVKRKSVFNNLISKYNELNTKLNEKLYKLEEEKRIKEEEEHKKKEEEEKKKQEEEEKKKQEELEKEEEKEEDDDKDKENIEEDKEDVKEEDTNQNS